MVDENDFDNINPLPNLDYKIVQGNSLLSIKRDIFNNAQLNKFEELTAEHFNVIDSGKKKNNKKEIEKLKNDILPKGTFDIRIIFSNIFKQNGGFDIVIGNPPYIQLQKDDGKLAKLYKNSGFKSFSAMGDIYSLFYEQGINILNEKGNLCYITSNKWMRAGYGEKLREYFLTYNPKILIDLGSGVFESATVDSNILLIEKSNNLQELQGATIHDQINDLNKYMKNNAVILSSLSQQPWFIGNKTQIALKNKIEKIGKPLKDWDIKIYRGILTGLNEAFIIDNETKEKICAEDPKSAEILKPVLRGRDIKRYSYDWQGLWLINSHNGYSDINRIKVEENYPAVYKHLLKHEKKASKRSDKGKHWTNLRNCAYLEEFEKEKIVYQEISQSPSFHLDNDNYFILQTAYSITGKPIKFLINVLNSRIFTYIFRKFYSGGGLGKAGYRYLKKFLETVPIPDISESEQQPFIDLVNQILEAKKQNLQADTSKLENEIDQLVYKLYQLTDEEIEIIEKEINIIS